MRPSINSLVVSLHPLGLIWGVPSAGPQAESHAREAGCFKKSGGQGSPWVCVQKSACLHCKSNVGNNGVRLPGL